MASCGARVSLALAPAGTGKTTAMATLARAWEDSGGTVIGLAPSAAAAEVLRQEIRVAATDTIAKYQWLHHNPEHDGDPARHWFDSIGPNTLLIVDEAGKAGTLELDTVIGHAMARGASVRLIGDDQQLASISAGGVLRDIRREHGARSLSRWCGSRTAPKPKPPGAARRRSRRAGVPHRQRPRACRRRRDRRRPGLRQLARRPRRRPRRAAARPHQRPRRRPQRPRPLRPAHRRRRPRRPGRPVAEVTLADTLRASAGDIICTRSNARWLRISATDYVRNGYRWQVENVTDTGGAAGAPPRLRAARHPAGHLRRRARHPRLRHHHRLRARRHRRQPETRNRRHLPSGRRRPPHPPAALRRDDARRRRKPRLPVHRRNRPPPGPRPESHPPRHRRRRPDPRPGPQRRTSLGQHRRASGRGPVHPPAARRRRLHPRPR